MIELMIGEVCACLPFATILCNKYWNSTKLSVSTFHTGSTTFARGNQRRCIPQPGSSMLISTTISGDLTQASSIHPVVDPVLISRAYHAGGSRAGSLSDRDSYHHAAIEAGTGSAAGYRSHISRQATPSRPIVNTMAIRQTTDIFVEVSHLLAADQIPSEGQEGPDGV